MQQIETGDADDMPAPNLNFTPYRLIAAEPLPSLTPARYGVQSYEQHEIMVFFRAEPGSHMRSLHLGDCGFDHSFSHDGHFVATMPWAANMVNIYDIKTGRCVLSHGLDLQLPQADRRSHSFRLIWWAADASFVAVRVVHTRYTALPVPGPPSITRAEQVHIISFRGH